MLLPSLPLNSITIISTFPCRSIRFKFKTRAIIKPLKSNPNDPHKSSAVEDSLRVLEWDKVCDCVSSFAGTSLGQEATKAQLWKLNQSYEESTSLLAETTAAVEMINFGGCGMDFGGINVRLVKSAIQHASRSLPVDGNEALAVASLLMLSEALQINVKVALKEDSDWYNRFMPLTELIMALYVNRALIKSIQQVIDEDGSVRDSASSNLKRSRDQVRLLEKKLFQLMDSLIRKESNETLLEVSNVNGRWCIKSGINEPTTANGLLLSSGSGVGNLVEPLSAVPLNDELQQARALVAKAEDDVLLKLTEKVQMDLDDIRDLLNSIIKLDVITARAKYSLSFGGTCPELFSTEHKGGYFSAEPHFQGNMTAKDASSHPTQRKWILYLPKAYHPLLLQQHRKNLQKARKDVTDAMAEIRRRLQWESMTEKDPDAHIKFLKMQVTKLEEAYPIPVDFFVGTKTRVLIITGPNTGGKTICLKTIGLATMMAKSGLYVLSSEPVRIPWFDFIFADIGDEQSLSQSLSTFSGHLRQISAIQAQSTSKSLVLLDEVGAGTNPLEGAALGMSLLESFAEAGCLLTVATTHHGELKTLKYSNDAFENACMEFDEVNMKPTYQILWGVPGRSNAINIAERLGVPDTVLDNARELYGTASAEINEVIINMEQFKKDFQEHVHEAQHYLAVSRGLHKKLLVAKQKIAEHEITQRNRKLKEISEVAAAARSALHKRLRLIRASATQPSKHKPLAHSQQNTVAHTQHATTDVTQLSLADKNASTVKDLKQSPSGKRISLPMVGDMVNVSSLGKTAMVLNADASKEEVVVQVNNLKLRLKLSDLQT